MGSRLPSPVRLPHSKSPCRPERSEGPHGISTSDPMASGMRSFASLRMTRKSFLQLAGAAFAAPAAAQTGARMNTRKIPATVDLLPVVGVGTWQTFDVDASPAERAPRAEVLKVLFAAG